MNVFATVVTRLTKGLELVVSFIPVSSTAIREPAAALTLTTLVHIVRPPAFGTLIVREEPVGG